MAEHNPDQYDWDVQSGGDRPKSRWSAGMIWHALPGVDLRLSLQHGDEIGFGFRSYLIQRQSLRGDRRIGSYQATIHLRLILPPQINKNKWYDRLLYDIERSGLILVEGTLSSDGNNAQLVVGNASYALWSDALARHTALADLHLPATVKSIYFVVEEGGHRTVTVVVPRPSASYSGNSRTWLSQIRTLSGRTLDTLNIGTVRLARSIMRLIFGLDFSCSIQMTRLVIRSLLTFPQSMH